MPNYLTSEENRQRLQRAHQLHLMLALAAIIVGFGLLWAVQDLVLPVTFAMVMAYISLPLVGYLKNRGFSRPGAIFTLFGIFILLLFSVLNLAGDLVPDQKTELEMQIRARYKFNGKFQELMGLDSDGRGGNWWYRAVGQDLEPLRKNLDAVLALSGEEQQLFAQIHQATVETQPPTPATEKYWRYFLACQAQDQAKLHEGQAAKGGTGGMGDLLRQTGGGHGALLHTIFSLVSLWLVTPLVFLTLLFDDGRLKRGLMRSVPNRYFELTLTVIDEISTALGRYLRGTALECFLVGLSYTLCLLLLGFDPRWAVAIGVISGLANAVPFLGTAIGLILGIIYAIMAEEITPLLPFVNGANLPLAVVASVFLVHLADNAIFQPYVLGSAVELHPLAIIMGVMGGTTLFGFAGMLLAIPAIVVGKVVLTTTFSQLRAYHIT
ncbi:MAG: AI-2E family transporter [Desulfobulbaceae bacterium]|nr:AI-2E family transporter [Desulfobulbaceae bacterium]